LAVELRDRLVSSPQVEIVQTTHADEAQGWQLFGQHGDKEWGMTDCVSFIIMRRMGVTDVLSFDNHFAQAGFSLLLQPHR
jgi:predicted nucleic acid-binding protein